MQYTTLGKSNLTISRLALGTMSITDLPSAKSIIATALDQGVNYFDTADLYQKGENEKMVGQVLKPHRKDLILATKVGNQWRTDGSGWDWNPRKAYLKKAVHDSLRRLKTDYIDLYQLHGGTIDDPIDEAIEAFEELIQEGHIRYYGISSIRHNVIHCYGTTSNIISNMMQYSLLDRRPEEWALDFLRKQEIGVIVRGAIGKGLLAGKPPQGKTLAQAAPNGFTTVEELQTGMAKLGDSEYSLADLAIQYVLAHPGVSTIALGASNAAQLAATLKAIDSPPLDAVQLEALRQMSPVWQYE
ncbi:MAG: aldo/keto reductase, partial [Bacteroidota bacterium]